MHSPLALKLMNFREDSKLVAALKSIKNYQTFVNYMPEAQQNGTAPIFEYITEEGIKRGLYWLPQENRLTVE